MYIVLKQCDVIYYSTPIMLLYVHDNMPRNIRRVSFIYLKVKETQILKQFDEAVKIQQQQFKLLKEHRLSSTPKSEQKSVIRLLKEEQKRKMAMLGQQYEETINDMTQHQNVSPAMKPYHIY